MIDPRDYVPSTQVQLLIQMIIDHRGAWRAEHVDERRFNRGVRHGLDIAYRALVAAETGITDAEMIDELCGNMIMEDLINKC